MGTYVSMGFECANRAARMGLALAALGCSIAAAATPVLTTLYGFAGGDSGSYPQAGVISYSGGTLIGTTPYGGTASIGTVFQLTPGAGGTWSETVLYSFKGGNDGAYPGAAPTLGTGSVLYGTTFAGGGAGAGTVYQLTPSKTGGAWTETVLYSFKGGSDGSGPLGGVIVGANGTLQGTTFSGGTGAGTVYQLTPPTGGTGPWSESVIYSFQGGKDGSGPNSTLASRSGALYGTTYSGTEGTVFEVSETAGTWNKTLVFNFVDYSIGEDPVGVVFDSNGLLYGNTTAGGSGGYGIAYTLKNAVKGKAWVRTTIHNYTGGTDGGSPYGSLTLGSAGVVYGTASIGGTYGAGAVIQFTPPTTKGQPWTETVLYSFKGGTDGSEPFSGLLLGSNNTLYGTALFDGTSGYGTVFQLVP